MEILNLGGAQENDSSAPKSRKKLRVLLGIGALAAVTGIGSTLAANITLNDGGNVEFGQGVATTASCDGDIMVTPVSGFDTEDDVFYLEEIQLSGIDTSTITGDGDTEGCAGKTLTIKAYDDAGSEPLYTQEVAVFENDPWFTGSEVDGGSVSGSGFTINVLSSINAGDVFKITVESKDTPVG